MRHFTFLTLQYLVRCLSYWAGNCKTIEKYFHNLKRGTISDTDNWWSSSECLGIIKCCVSECEKLLIIFLSLQCFVQKEKEHGKRERLDTFEKFNFFGNMKLFRIFCVEYKSVFREIANCKYKKIPTFSLTTQYLMEKRKTIFSDGDIANNTNFI